MRLILASASPRRAELLRAAGFTFDAVVADVDESIRPGESPSAYVRRLAADKSAAAQEYVASGSSRTVDGRDDGPPEGGHHVPVILGADTTVVVDGEILGKPRDDEDAARILRRLSGTRHEVLTGVSLRQGASEVGRVETTAVYFRALLEEDIAWYVASGEGRDKAGAYAIQGLASRFIRRIEGSYSNVVGLPIACVAELLRSLLASGR
jgi:septum formation protein